MGVSFWLEGTFVLPVWPRISLANSAFVFPSVLMPRLFAATMIGSSAVCVLGGCGLVGAAVGACGLVCEVMMEFRFVNDDSCLDALSYSAFAEATDLANSGILPGPHRKMTARTPTMTSAS